MGKHPGAFPNFEPGNSYAAIHTNEEYVGIFKEMYEYAIDEENDVLSLQDITTKWRMPKSSFARLCERIEGCDEYKQMIKDAIIARVNKGAIAGDFNSSPAIFRMKNLGELDEATVNQNHSGSMITEHKVIFEDYSDK